MRWIIRSAKKICLFSNFSTGKKEQSEELEWKGIYCRLLIWDIYTLELARVNLETLSGLIIGLFSGRGPLDFRATTKANVDSPQRRFILEPQLASKSPIFWSI